jgi:glycine cleavage system H protein
MSYPTNYPKDMKYTKDHEWAKAEGNTVAIGITDHAQRSLGDVVFVELPALGRVLKKGETFGVVESIKAVSDLYAPIAGKVVEVNSLVKDDPSQLNQDPHGKAWMVKIEPASGLEEGLSHLMSSTAYSEYVQNLK